MNTYMINISISLQDNSVNDITGGIQYDYYAIILADTIESAYEACERDTSSRFYKYVTKNYFLGCIETLDNKTGYPATPEMIVNNKKSTVLFNSYKIKNYTTKQMLGCGRSIRDIIFNYNIDRSLYN